MALPSLLSSERRFLASFRLDEWIIAQPFSVDHAGSSRQTTIQVDIRPTLGVLVHDGPTVEYTAGWSTLLGIIGADGNGRGGSCDG